MYAHCAGVQPVALRLMAVPAGQDVAEHILIVPGVPVGCRVANASATIAASHVVAHLKRVERVE